MELILHNLPICWQSSLQMLKPYENQVKSPEEHQNKADSEDATATINETIIPVQDPAIQTIDENFDNGGNSAEQENEIHETKAAEKSSTEVEETITSKLAKGLDGTPTDNSSDDESSKTSL